jgi:hypothetical protein
MASSSVEDDAAKSEPVGEIRSGTGSASGSGLGVSVSRGGRPGGNASEDGPSSPCCSSWGGMIKGSGDKSGCGRGSEGGVDVKLRHKASGERGRWEGRRTASATATRAKNRPSARNAESDPAQALRTPDRQIPSRHVHCFRLGRQPGSRRPAHRLCFALDPRRPQSHPSAFGCRAPQSVPLRPCRMTRPK